MFVSKRKFLQITLVAMLQLVCCGKTETPLRTPIFNTKDGKYGITLPFNRHISVNRYEIMEGDLGADETSFVPVDSQDRAKIKGSVMIIDISKLDINSGKQYSICVTTANDGTWYSEPFIYDEHQKKYVLARQYKGKPFYIKYLPHAGAVLAVGVIGGAIIYIIKSRTAKSIPEDNL